MKSIIKNKLSCAVIAGLSALAFVPSVSAVELLNVTTDTGTTKVSLGGYVKADIRHVTGDIAYQDYWLANFPGGQEIDTSTTGFNVKESRLNFKVSHGDVSGLIEFDLYGGGGNEIISNSTNPRLRHAYIQYKNWMIGQNWSTFMPLQALPEALDFGGPHAGLVFIRQTQIRYTNGNWQFAIENAQTWGDGDIGASSSAVGSSGANVDAEEKIPDFVGRYNASGDWGQISISGLLRKIDQGGLDETSMALNAAGKFNIGEKDDLKVSVTLGEPGRYASAVLTTDIVPNELGENEVESTTAFSIAYRHFWNETWRSTIFYGAAKTDTLERERSHFGVNLLTNLTPKLMTGVEIGRYAIDDEGIRGINSTYAQVSAKFSF